MYSATWPFIVAQSSHACTKSYNCGSIMSYCACAQLFNAEIWNVECHISTGNLCEPRTPTIFFFCSLCICWNLPESKALFIYVLYSQHIFSIKLWYCGWIGNREAHVSILAWQKLLDDLGPVTDSQPNLPQMMANSGGGEPHTLSGETSGVGHDGHWWIH